MHTFDFRIRKTSVRRTSFRSRLWLVSKVVLSGSLCLFATLSAFGQSYDKENLSWENGEVKLEGTLYLPKTDGPHPSAVFVHGSGTLSRFGRSGSMFREHAQRLSAQGLAVLIYDKRGAGQSTGDWKTATFEDLCNDVLGGVNASVKGKTSISRK